MSRALELLVLFMVLLEVSSNCDLDVIVIGAGVSGLGAAQELLYKGCNVMILEAQNRKGGRIYSIPLGDSIVDMGASWIHGLGPGAASLSRWKKIENPIYTIAKFSDITTIATWKDEDKSKESFYWYKSPSIKLDPERVYDLSDKIEDWIDENQDSASKSDSLDDVMDGFNHGSTTDDDLIYDFTMNYLFSQDYAADTDELSGRYFDDNEQFDGAEHIFPEGYSQIIDVLSQDLNINYEKVVTEINYMDDLVIIGTADGSSYVANKVIVTVPLGVLQSRKIAFNPPLSTSKVAAIQRLGYGLMDKLWLEFDETFWTNDENADWINYVSDTPGVFVQTLNIDKYFGKPLIVMFNVGEVARVYSNMTDEEVLESAMQIIRKWYPNAPNYVRYARSNWSQNPYSQGSYSFIKAGATPSDCELYSEFESTNNKVFFAGEATNCEMIGTVHGAYISGVDSANFAILGNKYKQDGFRDRYTQEESSSSGSLGYCLTFVLVLLNWI